jgi:hypothetical protein
VPSQHNAHGFTCQEVSEQATAFLENRLCAVSMNGMWRHLEFCSACRTYVEQLTLVRDSLRKLPRTTMSDRMRKDLLLRLARMARDTDNR